MNIGESAASWNPHAFTFQNKPLETLYTCHVVPSEPANQQDLLLIAALRKRL